jgi:hypothetical protein
VAPDTSQVVAEKVVGFGRDIPAFMMVPARRRPLPADESAER